MLLSVKQRSKEDFSPGIINKLKNKIKKKFSRYIYTFTGVKGRKSHQQRWRLRLHSGTRVNVVRGPAN